MPYADVNDLQIYYEWHGSEQAEPLLLLNGAFGAIDYDSDWGKELARFAQDYHVLAYEHRGHGRTRNPSGTFDGYDQLAADAAGLLRSQNISKAHIVGFSDGAITALTFGFLYPEMTDMLVSVSANYRNTPELINSLETLKADYIAEKYPDWAANLERQHNVQGAGHWRTLAEAMRPLWLHDEWLPAIDKIGTITAPTLLMTGQRDPYGTLEQTLEMHQAIKGSEICVLPGVGHGLTAQRADIVAAIILDFLARQRKRREKAHRPGN